MPLHKVSVTLTGTAEDWVEANDAAEAQARVEGGTGFYSVHVGSAIGEWSHVTPTEIAVVDVTQQDAE